MPDPAASPFAAVESGVRVAVRLQPGARRTAVEGVERQGDGRVVLKARVTAVPEAGKANAALIGLLAKSWGLPRSAVTLVAGGKERRKSLLVAGEPAALLARLEAWLSGLAAGRGR